MTETTHEPRRPDDAPAPRYWNVERLTCGMWLTTDYVESGRDEAQALARCQGIATTAGWDGARLGRELDREERHRYCSFAWILVS